MFSTQTNFLIPREINIESAFKGNFTFSTFLLYTLGLDLSNKKLREHYLDQSITILMEQPLASLQSKTYCYSTTVEKTYIDLAIIKADQVHRAWSNSTDREVLMEQCLLQMESLKFVDLLTTNDDLVIVRGVAGIGKSTLMEILLWEWAKHQLLTGCGEKSPKIDFLFLLTCREINAMGRLATVEELFQRKYPEVFQYISIEDLKDLAPRIAIIVDGLDELEDIYQLHQTTRQTATKNEEGAANNNLAIVTQLMQLYGNYGKNRHKTVICGRPGACELVLAYNTNSQTKRKIKTVEVCGFSAENVDLYIDQFFKSDQDQAAKVKQAVRTSLNLQAMSSIPVLTNAICNVYKEELISKPIHTHTELYLYGCLVFLYKHLHTSSNQQSTLNLANMVQDEAICGVLFFLAELSMRTYMKHQVVFTEDDIKHLRCPLHLEQTGFIGVYGIVLLY